MEHTDMIARLVHQAKQQGTDLTTLRAIVEEAAELGADRALSRLQNTPKRVGFFAKFFATKELNHD